jgi:polysaccharide biosynthesis protein PslG
MPKFPRTLHRTLRALVLAWSVSAVVITLPAASGYSPSAYATPISHSSVRRPHHLVLVGMDPLWGAQNPRVISSQLRGMKFLGVNAVRFEANWRWIQPTGPTKFYWARLDREVRLARAAHMTVDLVINDCPAWAAIPMAVGRTWPQPKSAEQYGTFAENVAERYAPRGVKLFEIWNEPNDSKYFQPVANVAAYTKMLIAAYKAIKKVDKSAFIISGGLAPVNRGHGSYAPIGFLQAMYANGAKGHFDALGDHPYSYPLPPNKYKPWSWWAQMSRTRPSLRSVMARHHDSGKRIWITEYGAPSAGPHGVGQKGQATELSQAVLDSKSTSWIGAIFLYSWQDRGRNPSHNGDWFGLLTFGGRKKAAYWAVKAAIRMRLP